MEQQSGIIADAQSLEGETVLPFPVSAEDENTCNLLINGWRLRPSENRLVKDQTEIRLEPKAMDLLLRLTAAKGDALSRADLISQLWPNIYASDDSLNQIVSRLRRSLAQDDVLAEAVITVPKRGYRLNKDIIANGVDPAEIDAPPATAPRKSASIVSAASAVMIGIAVLVVTVGFFIAQAPAAPQKFDYSLLRSSTLTRMVGHGNGARISPNGNSVAFAWGRESAQSTDIYVQRIGAYSPRKITDHPFAEYNPAWSPDGRELAFVRTNVAGDCNIVRLDLESGVEHAIHNCRAGRRVDLSWGRAGASIFFTDRVGETGPLAVHQLDLGTDQIRQITFPNPAHLGDLSVRVSPDGMELAFVRNETYLDADIYVAATNGTRIRPVTKGQRSIRGLSWEADSAYLIFATDRASAFGLWRAGKNNSHIEPIPTVLGDVNSVSVSPVGGRVVYDTNRVSSKVQKISLISADLDSEPTLEDVSSFDRFPDLSPDGMRLVQISDRSDAPALVILETGQDDATVLELDVDLIISASWSPDGSQLLVGAFADRNFDLFLVAPEGEVVRKLTNHPASDYNPTWSSDGKRAYFTSNRTGRFEIWCLDVATSRVEQISLNGGHRAIDVDGERLFFAKKNSDGLFALDLAGPVRQEKLITDGLSALDWRNWDRVGDNLYYVARKTQHNASLRRLDLEGGADTFVRDLGSFPLRSGLSVSPDETSAFITKIVSAEADLMILDGLSSKPENQRSLQASR